MGKRAGNSGAVTSKKQKTDPALKSIIDVIQTAEDMPKNVRDMMVEMLPLSLELASDVRHAVQEMAVNMIEKTLNAKLASLQGQIAAENDKLDKEKASAEELTQQVAALESAVESQKTVVEDLKNSSEHASSLANASLKAVEEKCAAHKLAEEKLMEAKGAKAGLEGALDTHRKAELGLSWDQLSPFVKELEIETSLLTALPSTCGKPKEQRGSFDMLVLQELDRAFTSKIEELAALVEKDSPSVAELEVALKAAEKDCEASKERKNQADEGLSAAQKELVGREDALKKASAEIAESKPRMQSLLEQLEAAKTTLKTFEEGPLTIFTIHKNKKSESVEAETPATTPADTEA